MNNSRSEYATARLAGRKRKMNNIQPRQLGSVLAILVAALLAPAVLAGEPTGATPFDPRRVTGAWQTLAPNATLWFYFDYTGDKSKIQVAADEYGAGKIQVAIFTPEQATAWLADPATAPIGLATPPNPNSASAIHDLVWLGAFNFPGRFFVVVTNNQAATAPFRLQVSGDSVALAPTPTPTLAPWLALPNPFATPIPVGSLQGQLVFQDASGGNIYTVNGDGSNLTRVTYGLDPAWSPDGKQIAFTRWNPPAGVFIADSDGSNEQAIMDASQALSPQWSPAGNQIAFTWQKGGTPESERCVRGVCTTIPANPYWKIGVVALGQVGDEVAGNRLSEPACTNHCFSPTWSGDGRYLAFADAGFGILRTDLLAPTRADPEGEVPPNFTATLFNQTPRVQSTTWSTDGSKIAFQAVQHDHWEIFGMNADGSGAQAVTRPASSSSTRVANNVAPVWSPDGKEILFLSDRNGKWEFFVVGADGSNLRQVLKSVTDAIVIRYNFSNERVADWN
ncbi:MAG: PD40 domain-containing protein [Chloroflexi bacterium]|nr:PD40 domain-containing protein [Chloroflexota bacterium]